MIILHRYIGTRWRNICAKDCFSRVTTDIYTVGLPTASILYLFIIVIIVQTHINIVYTVFVGMISVHVYISQGVSAVFEIFVFFSRSPRNCVGNCQIPQIYRHALCL